MALDGVADAPLPGMTTEGMIFSTSKILAPDNLSVTLEEIPWRFDFQPALFINIKNRNR
jgi:hypothetical protein